MYHDHLVMWRHRWLYTASLIICIMIIGACDDTDGCIQHLWSYVSWSLGHVMTPMAVYSIFDHMYHDHWGMWWHRWLYTASLIICIMIIGACDDTDGCIQHLWSYVSWSLGHVMTPMAVYSIFDHMYHDHWGMWWHRWLYTASLIICIMIIGACDDTDGCIQHLWSYVSWSLGHVMTPMAVYNIFDHMYHDHWVMWWHRWLYTTSLIICIMIIGSCDDTDGCIQHLWSYVSWSLGHVMTPMAVYNIFDHMYHDHWVMWWHRWLYTTSLIICIMIIWHVMTPMAVYNIFDHMYHDHWVMWWHRWLYTASLIICIMIIGACDDTDGCIQHLWSYVSWSLGHVMTPMAVYSIFDHMYHDHWGMWWHRWLYTASLIICIMIIGACDDTDGCIQHLWSYVSWSLGHVMTPMAVYSIFDHMYHDHWGMWWHRWLYTASLIICIMIIGACDDTDGCIQHLWSYVSWSLGHVMTPMAVYSIFDHMYHDHWGMWWHRWLYTASLIICIMIIGACDDTDGCIQHLWSYVSWSLGHVMTPIAVYNICAILMISVTGPLFFFSNGQVNKKGSWQKGDKHAEMRWLMRGIRNLTKSYGANKRRDP